MDSIYKNQIIQLFFDLNIPLKMGKGDTMKLL